MRSLPPVVLLALIPALLPVSARADASAYPVGPEKRISIVSGQPITVAPLAGNEGSLEEVRFAVDGKPIQTDHFAPFGDFISTRRFVRIGFALEAEHTLTATAIDFFSEAEIGRYPLVIHALPVVPGVHVYPLVFEDRTRLVGFQLHGIPRGGRVSAWGRGFIHGSAWSPLPLRIRKRGEWSRTYVVPGGLAWEPPSRHLQHRPSPRGPPLWVRATRATVRRRAAHQAKWGYRDPPDRRREAMHRHALLGRQAPTEGELCLPLAPGERSPLGSPSLP
jgi:hypothetical protein